MNELRQEMKLRRLPNELHQLWDLQKTIERRVDLFVQQVADRTDIAVA